MGVGVWTESLTHFFFDDEVLRLLRYVLGEHADWGGCGLQLWTLGGGDSGHDGGVGLNVGSCVK